MNKKDSRMIILFTQYGSNAFNYDLKIKITMIIDLT